jgi:hypothetical protein
MNFLLADLLGVFILIGIIVVGAYLLYNSLSGTFEKLEETPEKVEAARNAGIELAQNEIEQRMMLAQLQPSLGKASGRRAGAGWSGTPRWMRGGFMVMLMFAMCVAGRVEFGNVHGRFHCENTLSCARDNSYHELRFRVYPLEASGEWTTVPWLFAPFHAGDAISGPSSCDPRKTGQCYLLNAGALTVSVRAAPLFWHNALSKHPVYEFPATYAIDSTRYAGNVTDALAECDRLRRHPQLFGDAGACWKHLCMDGAEVVDTETVGVGPGCGLFEFTDTRAQLTTAFEVRVTDTTFGTTTTLAFDNVRQGARVQNIANTMHAHVDVFEVPGGENWVYPQQLQGGVVACNWRETWEKYRPLAAGRLDMLPVVPPATATAGWYYVSPGRLLASYGHRACGMNGPALYRLATLHSGGACTDGPSFETGECLPETHPAQILNGTAWAPEYVPPTWRTAASRAGLWQKANGNRGAVHLARARDFLPGSLYYDVVLRVASPVARTDMGNRERLHSALCIEESTLQCVQDPETLIVRIDALVGNRAANVNATGVTGSIACTYKGQGAVNVTVGQVEVALGTIAPGKNARLVTIFQMPEEGVQYVPDGVPHTRDKPTFTCAIELRTNVKTRTAAFKWSGPVTCEELVKNQYVQPIIQQDCSAKESGELLCRMNQGSVGDSTGSIALLTAICLSMAFNVGMGVYFFYRYRRLDADSTAKLQIADEHARRHQPCKLPADPEPSRTPRL